MIAYFPTIYPDELVYSWFARYRVGSGHLAYRYVAAELYKNSNIKPDIDFINELSEEAKEQISQYISMEDLVKQHTMFNYYGRFICKERKNKAFKALTKMEGNYRNLLIMPKPKSGVERYLRYCPICVCEDRKKYAECYWHRLHQIQEIQICPIHKCGLYDSSVAISSRTSPSLITAEEAVVDNQTITFSDCQIECRFVEYVAQIFYAEVDWQTDILVGDFLYSRMSGTKYRSVRGEQRNIGALQEDVIQYYKECLQDELNEMWKIQKILCNDRVNFLEICMLAMFLEISVEDLLNMELPIKSQQELFDEQVHFLHQQGLKYPEIAKKLDASYDTVKAIGEKRYGTYNKKVKKTLKSAAKPKNWQNFDETMLPQVKHVIEVLQGNGTKKPKKIGIRLVEKILDIPKGRIRKSMPCCRAEIEKYEETQEEYWAREVVWAVQNIIGNGEELSWRKIRELTNMRVENFVACMPYIEKYADSKSNSKISLFQENKLYESTK